MNNPNPPALQLDHLSLAYPTSAGKDILALDGVSLTVASGQVYGLLGKPGSGKTSLLRAAAGQIPAYSGRIEIFGRELTSRPDPSAHSWLQGDPQPDPSLLLAPGPASGLHEDLRNLAAALELDLRAPFRFSQLSHRLQERACLVPILLDSRPLLLLDEHPGLTPETAALLQDWLPDHFHASGQTLVIATSSPEMVQKLCDRAAVLYRGRLAYEGPVCCQPGPIAKSTYCIRLGGRLDAARAVWLDGLSVRADGDDTLIAGEFADQAALYGLIGCARDLGLTLISVHRQAPGPIDRWREWMERG